MVSPMAEKAVKHNPRKERGQAAERK